ncbi:unnamed protein product [Choristocarpus tenellus]
MGDQNLNSEQIAALNELRTSFPLDRDSNGLPLDDSCLMRYLRARNWNVSKAGKMLSATLDWRRNFGVEKVLNEEGDVIARENSTGKIYLRGYDKAGRPIMIMRPRCENTKNHDGNIKHLVYQMERARTILQDEGGGKGKMCLAIDFGGYSMFNATPMKTSKETLNILQNHYPETLGVAYMLSPPLLFKGFWNVIYPFIDPTTKEKFMFVSGSLTTPTAQEALAKNFILDSMEESLGGKNKVPFDSATYLKSQMNEEYEAALASSSPPAANS